MPKQKRGRSKQDYGTPDIFTDAVAKRFGPLAVDLAASAKNTKAPIFISAGQNSLVQDWKQYKDVNCWLNPPFSNIGPWARKCAEYATFGGVGRLFFLTPASVGSNWYRDFVHLKAHVIFLNARITFVGEKMPYPKDCMLSVFGAGLSGFTIWNWNGFQTLGEQIKAIHAASTGGPVDRRLVKAKRS